MEHRDFFISHTEEDRDSALALARDLREQGSSTWTYEEDSIAATSYLTQIDAAIERCRAFLLLASKTSVASHQVIREVERAHECAKLIVVVRLGLTHPEYLKSNAILRMASGTGVTLSLDATDSGDVAAKVAETLQESSSGADGTLTPSLPSDGAAPGSGRDSQLEVPAIVGSKRRWWWRGRAVLGAAALLVLLLASIPLSMVQVDVHVRTSRATVTSKKTQNLSGLLAVNEVVFLGSFAIDAPAALSLPSDGHYLRVIASGPDPIVLEPVEVAAGDRVTFESGADRGRYGLQIEAPRAKSVAISVSRGIRVDSDGTSFTTDLKMARQLVATWKDSEPADLTFTTMVEPVTNAIAIQGLELKKLETVANIARPVSSVVDGRIEFPDREKRPIPINRGEEVALGGLNAVMSALDTTDGALSFTVAGSAQAIEIGESGRHRSHVPTLLEHITKQPNWVVISGSLGLLVVIVVSMWTHPR